MKTLALLLKREYWEHRGGFLWTPVWITGSILILTVLGIVAAEVFRSHAHISVGFSLDDLNGRIGAGEFAEAANALDVVQLTLGGIASIGVFFVTFFYLLGALYDDRRDRSVLFWKSLPVSDTATVASKAISALAVIPLIALAVATLAYLVFVALLAAWVGLHGLNALPAILGAHPLRMFERLAATLPVGALWALPTVGWLLFWSAWARSRPFLWAVVIPIVAVVANSWFGLIGLPSLGNAGVLRVVLGRLLLGVMPGSWIGGSGVSIGSEHVSLSLDDDHIVTSLDPARYYGLLAAPELWIGVLGGLVLLAAAVWLRRRRIETSV